MAKKKRRPLRDQDPKLAREQSPKSSREITILRPAHIARSKRPVLRISETLSFEHSITTLGDRFNALPAELRAHIFSLLLARPVKWDVEHQPQCPRRQSDYDITPTMGNSNQCSAAASQVEWRKGNCNMFQSPWRSQWAEEPQHPYVCSICYDHRLRTGPTPTPRTLPCLCARRPELQLLLVCKKWYQEAGTVLYTQNTWAFEPGPGLAQDDFQTLSHLELDALFLASARTVKRMLRLGLRNLKQVKFVRRMEDVDNAWKSGTPSVWPAFSGRKLIVGGFAEEVARGIKGQRQLRLKKFRAIKNSVDEMQFEFIKPREE
ncbi:uncharacterized protein MYCFIDRAFT_75524 [Pseudocercospora fijiensis CIRAD86]|uniref:Uncharacterized protein n=1 Tax=Pseudocercospora fijiensis (strain CIRAD86) TaxID=383855 RepID=N1Q666_PSEFD|nr:uncharacterized protein MYCFIDRAFT_75524 [Pseudocercospora fijiensis CIRAD86]EME87679.1 hypothetical protein MYCFIDRAFT_75524 [Pseudocercospora fijiensis CIRAD86]